MVKEDDRKFYFYLHGSIFLFIFLVIDQCFNEKNIIDNKDQDIVVESEVKPGNNQTGKVSTNRHGLMTI